MSFLWPQMLFSLLLLPVLLALYIRLLLRRRRLASSYSSFGLAGTQAQRGGLRRHVPPAISMLGLALLLGALARPQAMVQVPRVQGTVILAFDVSGSMGADDMQPTRLQAAQAAAREFVAQQPPSVLIGIVTFSDNGFVVQAPTTDQEAVLAAINRLAPARGTSVAGGILSSLAAIAAETARPSTHLYSNLTPAPTPTPTPVPPGEFGPAAIVMLTDGENNESPDPLAAAQAAADRGVRIYTIGIGSPAGATLHIDGFTVFTQLDEALLQRISQITGGAYYNATDEQDLQAIYEHLNPQLVIKPEKTEVTALFAGASILVLLVGGFLSLVWFGHMP